MKNKKENKYIETKEIKLLSLGWCIQQTRDENPYPLDIFTGETKEGKIGKLCNQVWNDALDKLVQNVKYYNEENEK